MCEATVFLVRDGDKKQLMDNVVAVNPEGDRILLTDLFGEQKLISAKIEKVNLTGHEIILLPTDPSPD